MADAVWAAQNGDLNRLTELTFDVNDRIKGRTLLHIAADYGQIEVIKYLVETKKGDINAIDTHGISVLLAAIYGSEGQANQDRYKTCISYLLEKNADKSGKGPDGSSYVDSTDNEEIKQLLR